LVPIVRVPLTLSPAGAATGAAAWVDPANGNREVRAKAAIIIRVRFIMLLTGFDNK